MRRCTLLALAACGRAAGSAGAGPSARENAYNFSHVRLVEHDASSGNWLFRGGSPIDRNTFDYEGLVGALRLQARAARLELPASFELVDLSFLWSPHDQPSIDVEEAFFARHPERGRHVLWSIYGVSFDDPSTDFASVARACKALNLSACPSEQPADFAPADRALLARHYASWAEPADLLSRRLAAARAMLATRADRPVVLYGHCHCGCDRTGEFFAAWALRYGGRTFEEAMAEDEAIVRDVEPHITYANQVAVQWYCLHLQATVPAARLGDCSACRAFRCKGRGFA